MKASTGDPAPQNTAANAVAARLPSPLSNWAQPCNNWKKGECTRGVSCHYHHVGCGHSRGPEALLHLRLLTQHVSGDCPCPGGGKDPKKDEHWQEYRERRKQAEEAGKIGKGPKGKGKGKGKSKGKDSKTKPEAAKGGSPPQQAKACVDLARAAAVDTDVSARFPRDGVALGSWANVWLEHVKDQPSFYFQDKLQRTAGVRRLLVPQGDLEERSPHGLRSVVRHLGQHRPLP